MFTYAWVSLISVQKQTHKIHNMVSHKWELDFCEEIPNASQEYCLLPVCFLVMQRNQISAWKTQTLHMNIVTRQCVFNYDWVSLITVPREFTPCQCVLVDARRRLFLCKIGPRYFKEYVFSLVCISLCTSKHDFCARRPKCFTRIWFIISMYPLMYKSDFCGKEDPYILFSHFPLMQK